MRHHHGMRMLLLEFHDAVDRELLMDMAATIPQEHVAPRDAVDIVAKVIIRPKDDFCFLWETRHHLLGIARGDHTVRERLDSRRGVDIAHHLIARMLLFVFLQVCSIAAVGQRAARCEVGTEHCLVGREQFAGLCHEVHATHHHHLRVGVCRLTGQSQRVTDKVSDVLDVAYGIVVRQDDGILLLAQLSDGLLQVQSLGNRLIDIPFFLPFLLDCLHAYAFRFRCYPPFIIILLVFLL